MTSDYNPRLQKYGELWRKFSKEKKPASDFPNPKVKSQEDSIKWSLKLQNTLDKKAQKTGHSTDNVKKEFSTGSKTFIPSLFPNLTRVHWGLAHVNMLLREGNQLDFDGLLVVPDEQALEQSRADVKNDNLDFDFDNVDELFLEQETVTEQSY